MYNTHGTECGVQDTGPRLLPGSVASPLTDVPVIQVKTARTGPRQDACTIAADCMNGSLLPDPHTINCTNTNIYPLGIMRLLSYDRADGVGLPLRVRPE